MKGLFGEKLYDSSIKMQADEIGANRAANSLVINRKAGTLAVGGVISSAVVKANTFLENDNKIEN